MRFTEINEKFIKIMHKVIGDSICNIYSFLIICPSEYVWKFMVVIPGCHYDPSVPTSTIKRHPVPKISSKVANLPLYYDEGELEAAFGYIISFKMESGYHRRIEFPVYENSICTSFPDEKFSGFRGYLYVEKDLPGTK